MPLTEEKRRGSVLIIEDEEQFRRYLEKVVREEFDFTSTGRWSEAASLLETHDFDIALVDLRLPGTPGREIVGALLGKPSLGITPIVITGFGGDWHRDAALAGGAFAYFTKGSFAPGDLVASMRKALSEKENRPCDRCGIVAEMKREHETGAAMLQKLYEFTNEIISLDSLGSVLDAAISFLKKVTGCARISIMLLSEDGNHLAIKKAIGLERDVIESTHVKIGDKIAGKAFKQGRIISSRRIEHDGTYASKKMKGPFMSVPLVEIPCTNDGKPIGVINLTGRIDGRVFTQNERQFIRFIANSTSIAVKNELRKEALEKSSIDTLVLLANVMEARDKYTQGHSVRVGSYASKIARRLGFSKEESGEIKYAGQLHDIGKIEIPDAILLKPDRLTRTEYEVMKRHPLTSKRIVDHIAFFGNMKGLFLHHHEHYDGSGYPDGIQGDKIELGARIIAVADAYDAMTSERPYRNAMPREKALSILFEQRGRQFDPRCVDALAEFISRSPQNA